MVPLERNRPASTCGLARGKVRQLVSIAAWFGADPVRRGCAGSCLHRCGGRAGQFSCRRRCPHQGVLRAIRGQPRTWLSIRGASVDVGRSISADEAAVPGQQGAGVTSRWGSTGVGSSRHSADRIARSGQTGGLGDLAGRTASSWRQHKHLDDHPDRRRDSQREPSQYSTASIRNTTIMDRVTTHAEQLADLQSLALLGFDTVRGGGLGIRRGCTAGGSQALHRSDAAEAGSSVPATVLGRRWMRDRRRAGRRAVLFGWRSWSIPDATSVRWRAATGPCLRHPWGDQRLPPTVQDFDCPVVGSTLIEWRSRSSAPSCSGPQPPERWRKDAAGLLR